MLTQDRLRTVLSYDVGTGLFTRLLKQTGIKQGSVSGSKRPDGYIAIYVDRKPYLAHRLAVLYMTGEWPEQDVDHIDMVRDNNAWDNLRCATRKENSHNRGKNTNNKSGHKGVFWATANGLWCVKMDGVQLGYRANLEDACRLYESAQEKKYGNFART